MAHTAHIMSANLPIPQHSIFSLSAIIFCFYKIKTLVGYIYMSVIIIYMYFLSTRQIVLHYGTVDK